MKYTKYLLQSSVAVLVLIGAAGCSTEEPPTTVTPPPPIDAAKTASLHDISTNVIVAAVVDFDVAAEKVATTVATLNTQRNQDNLMAAREAWRASRRPWEFCEAFLFGPAKNQQIDPSIDSWPLDQITIDSILSSTDPITKEYLEPLEGTSKGFHAIEFLLFGEKGDKTADKLTDREMEYLIASTGAFRDATARLRKAWEPLNDNDSASYWWQLSYAGISGSLYRTQDAGLAEILGGLVGITSELENAKMGNPYFANSALLEEDRFSGNSNFDFIANVEGVRAVYTGEYHERANPIIGHGLSDLVKAKSGGDALDAKVRQQLDDAVSGIRAITPNFGDAITSNRTAIANAITKVRELNATLDNDVRKLLFPPK
jgi:putative iron-regulated protein